MRILSVDPGSTKVGWAIFDYSLLTEKLDLLDCGAFTFKTEGRTIAEQIEITQIKLWNAFCIKIEEYDVNGMAKEIVPGRQFSSRSKVQATANTLLCLSLLYKLSLVNLGSQAVKKATTGSAKAEKSVVRSMMLERYVELSTDYPFDVYDGIAVGVASVELRKWKP